MAKTPNPIDRHVGARVKLRRKLLAMSQEKLGDKLGITFQQVQKYEKGTNRIGASRLQQISGILSVPVAFFFEGAPGQTGHASSGAPSIAAADTVLLTEFFSLPHAKELAQNYVEIDNLSRRTVADVARMIAIAAQPQQHRKAG